MSDPAALNERARHDAFLDAAWIAHVDGAEDGVLVRLTENDVLIPYRRRPVRKREFRGWSSKYSI